MNDENVCNNFPQFKEMYSDLLFCPTNSTEPKKMQFTVIYDKEANVHIWEAGTSEFLRDVWLKCLIN